MHIIRGPAWSYPKKYMTSMKLLTALILLLIICATPNIPLCFHCGSFMEFLEFKNCRYGTEQISTCATYSAKSSFRLLWGLSHNYLDNNVLFWLQLRSYGPSHGSESLLDGNNSILIFIHLSHQPVGAFCTSGLLELKPAHFSETKWSVNNWHHSPCIFHAFTTCHVKRNKT